MTAYLIAYSETKIRRYHTLKLLGTTNAVSGHVSSIALESQKPVVLNGVRLFFLPELIR